MLRFYDCLLNRHIACDLGTASVEAMSSGVLPTRHSSCIAEFSYSEKEPPGIGEAASVF